MSDVEKRIEQWRAHLATRETISHADIKEMEDHLREEIEHLKSLSLSDDEAFLVARHRLGDTAILEGEFLKLNAYGRLFQRFCWAIMGVLLYFTAITFAGAASSLSLRFGYMGGLRGMNMGILKGTVQIAAFASTIVLALWLCARHLHRRTDSRHWNSIAAPTLAAVILPIGTVAFVALRILATPIIWRGITISPDYRYTELQFQIAAPVLLGGLFIVLYRRSRREAQGQA